MKFIIVTAMLILAASCGISDRNPLSGKDTSLPSTDQGDSDSWRIVSITASPAIISREETSTITIRVDRFYGLYFEWQTSLGELSGSGTWVQLTPDDCCTGVYQVSCTVSDGFGRSEIASVDVLVQ